MEPLDVSIASPKSSKKANKTTPKSDFAFTQTTIEPSHGLSCSQDSDDSFSARPNNSPKSVLCKLREKKGLSLNKLSKKLGIDRCKLLRLEKKPWQKLCLGDLLLLSAGFDIRFENLVYYFDGFQRHDFTRSSEKAPCYSFDLPEKVKVSALIKKQTDCFIGIVSIPPHATFIHENASQSQFIFGFVLKGRLHMTLSDKECVFRMGEGFSMGQVPYEIYNPNQIKHSKLMIVTLPYKGM